jgi:hypothetical protein
VRSCSSPNPGHRERRSASTATVPTVGVPRVSRGSTLSSPSSGSVARRAGTPRGQLGRTGVRGSHLERQSGRKRSEAATDLVVWIAAVAVEEGVLQDRIGSGLAGRARIAPPPEVQRAQVVDPGPSPSTTARRSRERGGKPHRSSLPYKPKRRSAANSGLARGVELLNRQTLGGDKQAQHRTALWTILSLRWPRLAEYLATHPHTAVGFFEPSGSPPDGVPADFVAQFADPTIQRGICGDAEGVSAQLDPDSIRLCVSA